VPAVEQLEQLGVGIGHPEEAIRLQVLQDPPPRALGRFQALELIARSNPRVAAGGGDHQGIPGSHDDGPPRLRLVAPPLDQQLLVSDPDTRSVS
jgi:hypothetical protein